MLRARLCIVSTIANPLRVFMGPHIRALSATFDVVLVCNGDAQELDGLLGEHVSLVVCPIRRDVSLMMDLYCLLWLRRFFRQGGFVAVHTLMPKSGLLGMLAAKLAGVKHRMHTFTGQVWATKRGVKRQLLKTMDRLLAACATKLLTDSPSQLEYLVDQRIVSRQRIRVLADGSICGVDVRKFARDDRMRAKIRRELSIAEDEIVFLFVGRLAIEKGVNELLTAFDAVAASCGTRT